MNFLNRTIILFSLPGVLTLSCSGGKVCENPDKGIIEATVYEESASPNTQQIVYLLIF